MKLILSPILILDFILMKTKDVFQTANVPMAMVDLMMTKEADITQKGT
jgi:hypothetical protein